MLEMDITIDEFMAFFLEQNLLWCHQLIIYWIFQHRTFHTKNTGCHKDILELLDCDLSSNG